MANVQNNTGHVLYILATIAYKAEDFQDAVWYCEKAQKNCKVGTRSQEIMELHAKAHNKLVIELKSQLSEAKRLLEKNKYREALELCDIAQRRKTETANRYQQEFDNIRRKAIVKSGSQQSRDRRLPVVLSVLMFVFGIGFYASHLIGSPNPLPDPTKSPLIDKKTATVTATIEISIPSTSPLTETVLPTPTPYSAPTPEATPTIISYRTGVITDDNVRLRTGPGTFYSEQGIGSRLDRYAQVQIIESVISDNRGNDNCPDRAWYKVRLPDERTEAYICAYFVRQR